MTRTAAGAYALLQLVPKFVEGKKKGFLIFRFGGRGFRANEIIDSASRLLRAKVTRKRISRPKLLERLKVQVCANY